MKASLLIANAAIPVLTAFLLWSSGDGAQRTDLPTPPSGIIQSQASHSQASSDNLISQRPVAIEFAEGGQLIVACESGRLCIVDENHATESAEVSGDSFSDLTVIRSENGAELFVASDFKAHQLVGFEAVPREPDGDELQLIERWRVGTVSFPGSVEASPSTNLIASAGLWSRQVSLFDPEDLTEVQRIDLSFPPKHLCWLTAEELLVADAFGEMIALVDAEQGRAVYEHRLAGHRTGALKLSEDGETVYFADQRLNPRARSTHNDVHWGLMIANQLRSIKVDELLAMEEETGLKFESRDIGGPDKGKADPGDMVQMPSGEIIVAIGGTGELAFLDAESSLDIFVHAGMRPVDIAIDFAGENIFVCDKFDDSISVVDIGEQQLIRKTRLPDCTSQPAASDEIADTGLYQLGERMFFDSSLSHDSWISCHSCHVEGHTSGMLNDNFSDETFYTPKRILTLLGRKETAPFSWNGTSETLLDQTRTSIESTMQSDDPADEQVVRAISYYIETLEAPPAVSIARSYSEARSYSRAAADPLIAVEDSIGRGRDLFMNLSCTDCHSGDQFTSDQLVDVGMQDEKGATLFNPPSLRGLGQRDTFFHDSRTNSLRDVFERLEHQLPRKLTGEELSDLISFLQTL
ncbi:MAG: cytochrome c peroxidase [Planctomycetota bacterium]